MNRSTTVLCLSLSLIAIGIASLGLIQGRSGSSSDDRAAASSDEALREIRETLTSLSERVDELAVARSDLESRARSRSERVEGAGEPASDGNEDIETLVADLSGRLARLEDGETIARLAESGEEQLIEKEISTSLANVVDREASPAARLEALRSFRSLVKSKQYGDRVEEAMHESGLRESDIVMPMLELARDRTLDVAFRADVLRNLAGTRLEEARQPLLDMLAYEQSPELRGEALGAVVWHLEDASVREAITLASQGDPDERVRERAQRYMPKVEYMTERAAERAAERSGEASNEK